MLALRPFAPLRSPPTLAASMSPFRSALALLIAVPLAAGCAKDETKPVAKIVRKG